jgi:DNA-directed RNA polymerase subunit omega
MILPLDDMIDRQGNVYEMTVAAIKRAAQITVAGDEDIEDNDGKIVSTAIKQIIDKKVEFKIDE